MKIKRLRWIIREELKKLDKMGLLPESVDPKVKSALSRHQTWKRRNHDPGITSMQNLEEQGIGHPCQNVTQACCEKCHTAGWTDGVTNLSPSDPCYEATSDPEFDIAACKCCMEMEERWTCTATGTKYPGHDANMNPMGDAIPIGGTCVSSFGQPDWPYASLEECEAAGCSPQTTCYKCQNGSPVAFQFGGGDCPQGWTTNSNPCGEGPGQAQLSKKIQRRPRR